MKKTKFLRFRIEAELREALEGYCRKNGHSLSEFMRDIVAGELLRRESGSPSDGVARRAIATQAPRTMGDSERGACASIMASVLLAERSQLPVGDNSAQWSSAHSEVS